MMELLVVDDVIPVPLQLYETEVLGDETTPVVANVLVHVRVPVVKGEMVGEVVFTGIITLPIVRQLLDVLVTV